MKNMKLKILNLENQNKKEEEHLDLSLQMSKKNVLQQTTH